MTAFGNNRPEQKVIDQLIGVDRVDLEEPVSGASPRSGQASGSRDYAQFVPARSSMTFGSIKVGKHDKGAKPSLDSRVSSVPVAPVVPVVPVVDIAVADAVAKDASRTADVLRPDITAEIPVVKVPVVEAPAAAAFGEEAPAVVEAPAAVENPATVEGHAADENLVMDEGLARTEEPATAEAMTADEDGEGIPYSSDELRSELDRVKIRDKAAASLRGALVAFVTAAAIAVLVAVFVFPVLQVSGGSMKPTLLDGDLVLTVKNADLEQGDLVAFYYNKKALVKRVIAEEGDWVDIQKDGTVLIDGAPLSEPYLLSKSLGTCDIKMPYQVPESRIFVMGDNRATSVDSRCWVIGPVSEEQIIGKIVFRIWPLDRFGAVG